MKLTQIFGIVVLIHLGIVGVLLIQPGCQSQPRSAPDPSMTETEPQTTTAAARRGSEPSRPSTAARTERRDLDSAFNAGLEPGEGRSSPSRPASRTQERRTDTTETAGSGRLRPVVDSFDDEERAERREDAAPAQTRTYTVQRGDTLSAIARREGVSLDELLSANNLSRNATIYAGQELRVPASGSGADAPADPVSRDADTQTYTVVAGDNLTRIANRHDVTVAEIRRLNNLTSDTIRVGQTLRIPRVSGGDAPRENVRESGSSPAPSNGNTYTVRSGDTPITIARRFGVEPDELMRANNISDPRRLFVGRELVIPGGGTAPARTAQVRAPAPAPEPRAERPRETPAAIPLRERPGQPAIIDQQPAGRRAMTLDDLESLDDDDLRYVEVEDADGGNNGN
ncbi:MAG: LysM peptidoglycan-binding domain-containing protein [Opitutales bacterium]|nr:LysM peptidoglycan-binding domain-containing protein [Opitutales bacterium]